MNQKLLAMLNEAEQELIRETAPKRLAELDEDELLDLHTRVRRARTKYAKLYRRRAGKQVAAEASRGRASAANARTRVKAEVFEDALAAVSRRLGAVAKASAAEIRGERLAAARGERAGSAAPVTPAPPAGGGSRSGAVKRGGDDSLRSPIAKKATASTRATGKRRQAKRDGR